MKIGSNTSELIKKRNIKFSSPQKKHYYNLKENPFIDLTDDEEEEKKSKIMKEIPRKIKYFKFRIMPIYQEDFYNLFSRQFILHKYDVFNQEINGLYTSKRMKQLFENLFRNYNNLFLKKIPYKNKTIFDIKNKNRINEIKPLFNEQQNNEKINSLNIDNTKQQKMKRFSSLETMLDSLKNRVIMQRKQLLNNKLLLNNNSNNSKNNLIKTSSINKNLDINNFNFDNKKINRNFFPILKSNSTIKLDNKEKIEFNNLKLKHRLKNKSKNINNSDDNRKYKIIKLNQLLKKDISKLENRKNIVNIKVKNKRPKDNIFFKDYIKYKNKSLIIPDKNKIKNKNNSYDFAINNEDKEKIKDFLINKYSQHFFMKLKLIDNPELNSSFDINSMNSILLNKNKI